MSRLLVTGARGLIGRRVLGPLAEAGHEIHAVTRGMSADSSHQVAWHQADLLTSSDIVAVVRPEVMVHLAWDVTPGRFWTSPGNRDWLEASTALIERFARCGGRRVVIAGTCAEYDWTSATDGIMREANTPVRPATLYGRCKDDLRRRGEHLASELGFEFAWGRIFFLFAHDEDERRLFASVARSLLAGKPARTSPGDQIRDFMHADDVGRAFAAIAESVATGPINVGTGRGTSVRALVEEIGRAVGRLDLVELGALPAVDEPDCIVADAGRLNHEVGFRPTLGLRDGIERAVRALTAEVTTSDG